MLIITLISLINFIILIPILGLLIKVVRLLENNNAVSIANDDIGKQYVQESQMYNVEKFKERFKKQQLEKDQNEDGLYNIDPMPTLEELGYYTGVEYME